MSRGDFGRENVSIHAFRGEGDYSTIWLVAGNPFVSIHAFRGEGDT